MFWLRKDARWKSLEIEHDGARHCIGDTSAVALVLEQGARKVSSVLIIAGRAATIASWLDHVPIRQKVRSPVLMMTPRSRPGHLALPLLCASRKAASSPAFTLNLTTL